MAAKAVHSDISPANVPGQTLVRWSGHTDRGRVRKNNEDAFLGIAIDAHEVRHLGKVGVCQPDRCGKNYADATAALQATGLRTHRWI